MGSSFHYSDSFSGSYSGEVKQNVANVGNGNRIITDNLANNAGSDAAKKKFTMPNISSYANTTSESNHYDSEYRYHTENGKLHLEYEKLLKEKIEKVMKQYDDLKNSIDAQNNTSLDQNPSWADLQQSIFMDIKKSNFDTKDSKVDISENTRKIFMQKLGSKSLDVQAAVMKALDIDINHPVVQELMKKIPEPVGEKFSPKETKNPSDAKPVTEAKLEDLPPGRKWLTKELFVKALRARTPEEQEVFMKTLNIDPNNPVTRELIEKANKKTPENPTKNDTDAVENPKTETKKDSGENLDKNLTVIEKQKKIVEFFQKNPNKSVRVGEKEYTFAAVKKFLMDGKPGKITEAFYAEAIKTPEKKSEIPTVTNTTTAQKSEDSASAATETSRQTIDSTKVTTTETAQIPISDTKTGQDTQVPTANEKSTNQKVPDFPDHPVDMDNQY